MRMVRVLVVVLAVAGSVWFGSGVASAHSDSCLLSVHIGGIQEHLGCT